VVEFDVGVPRNRPVWRLVRDDPTVEANPDVAVAAVQIRDGKGVTRRQQRPLAGLVDNSFRVFPAQLRS
jgi:hypothetical protein